MRLATWNVNSLKVRLPHVLDWLAANPVDVLCLQETKQQDSDFPQAELQAAGYHSLFSGQKTYNGVAILSRAPGSDVQHGIPDHGDDQKRVIAATYGDIRVVDVYIPNGQSIDSDKYQYKLDWLDALRDWLKEELTRYPKLVLLGDYNIAPEDRDVHDPVAGRAMCWSANRNAQQFRNLVQLGLHDSFRLFEQAEKSFTWWDYRMMAIPPQPWSAHRPYPDQRTAGGAMQELCDRQGAEEAGAAVGSYAGGGGVVLGRSS